MSPRLVVCNRRRSLRNLGDVVGHLRDRHGRPKWQVRVIAVLAVIGMIGISAPALLSLFQ